MLQYSVASATFLSMQQISEAQIIYTDVDPDITVTVNGSDTLDIDADGTNDFVIRITQVHGTSVSYSGSLFTYDIRRAQIVPLSSNAIGAKVLTNNSYTYFSPYLIPPADGINSDDHFFASPGTFGSELFVNGSLLFQLGAWNGKSDSMMAIGLKKDDDFYFGWLRLSVSAFSDTVTIHDYAYNAVAGEAIFAASVSSPVTEVTGNTITLFAAGTDLHINTVTGGTVSVFDTGGRLVRNEECYPGNNVIGCGALPAGNYVAVVHTEEGTTGKIVNFIH